jgi:hypothetical protein
MTFLATSVSVHWGLSIWTIAHRFANCDHATVFDPIQLMIRCGAGENAFRTLARNGWYKLRNYHTFTNEIAAAAEECPCG